MKRGLWMCLGMLAFVESACRAPAVPRRTVRAPERASPLPDLTARTVGTILEGTVPLLGGGGLPLKELRGFVVLLELGSASHPRWAEAQRNLGVLARTHESDLRVISVVCDANLLPAGASWHGDMPPFVLGWDPQGALALRLGATRLPTRFVLDRSGRVVTTIAGAGDPLERELERHVLATIAEES